MDQEMGIQLERLEPFAYPDGHFHYQSATNPASDHEVEEPANLLSFVHLLQRFGIRPVHVHLIDSSGVGTLAATGSLGRGGQYVVDRVFANQRYPTIVGLKSESNTVYKRLIHSQKNQGISTRLREDRTLLSFVREIRALGYFRSHSSIVDILGVAWEDVDGQICPILALEFAQLNSLPNFLHSIRNTPLTAAEKRGLTRDITVGLSALHDAGFIWGDCKPENVLVFPTDQEPIGLRAKLNDFGCSILNPTTTSRFVGFSEPWTAPEAYYAQGAEALQRAEMYSYGMLIWTLQMDGMQFHPKYWMNEDNARTSSDQTDRDPSQTSISTAWIEKAKHNGTLAKIAIKSIRVHLGAPNTEIRASQYDLEETTAIIETTMAGKPEHRSLLLHSTLSPPSAKCLRTMDMESFEAIDFDALMKFYGSTTCLDRVAATVLQKLLAFSHTHSSGWGFYKASICHAVGFGTSVNFEKAITLMKRSAVLDFDPAKALYAILIHVTATGRDPEASDGPNMDEGEALIHFDDFSQTEVQGVKGKNKIAHSSTELEWCARGMITGSIYASAYLRQHESDLFKATLTDLRRLYRGIGQRSADWAPIDQEKYSGSKNDSAASKLRPNCSIHEAAQSGDIKSVEALLETPEINTESRNEDGETPLICAIRSGHLEVAGSLILQGADVEAIDKRGATVLHWLVSLTETEIKQLRPYLPKSLNSQATRVSVSYSQHFGSTLPPGTPLDWAVDARNSAAVEVLLEFGADPLTETTSRISAFNRAVAKYDREVISALIESPYFPTKGFRHFDSHGQSPLSYCLQHMSPVERALLGHTEARQDNMTWVMSMLLHHGTDPSVINDANESALYLCSKYNHRIAVLQFLYSLLPQEDSLAMTIAKSGPNRWSPLRRALYSRNTSMLRYISSWLSQLSIAESLVDDVSPDGLTLLHECAFLSGDSGVIQAKTLRSILYSYQVSWEGVETRLSERGRRAALTSFQLAVLCHNFELADFLVEWGCNPLRGVNRARFLGFLISYQMQDAYEPSTFLNAIIGDAVLSQIRRFPHPGSMLSAIAYLLRNESAWWDFSKNRSFGKRWLQELDEDADHDPLLSWRPGLRHLLATIAPDGKPPKKAIARYGYNGILDTNEIGFGLRATHIKDYRSFILTLRYDSMTEQQYAHKYITAIDAAFDGVLGSPYPSQAEKVFHVLLDHFNERQFCNFPHVYYRPLPFFKRTSTVFLRRRETVLHRAIRQRKVAIVKHLLEAGADWNIANIHWQTPLHLARLSDLGENPNTAQNHGSFFHRLGLAKPVQQTLVDIESSETTQILALLEKAAVETSAGPWPIIRALKEVRWPWDDYESDDMGVRFLLFYFLIVLAILFPAMLITGGLFIVKPLMYQDFESLKIYGAIFASVGKCLEDSKLNGSSFNTQCQNLFDKTPLASSEIPTRELVGTYASAIDNAKKAYMDGWNKCYQDPNRGGNGSGALCGIMATLKNPSLGGNLTAQMEAEKALTERICHCRCSFLGVPSLVRD